jgi:hypothetical protein
VIAKKNNILCSTNKLGNHFNKIETKIIKTPINIKYIPIVILKPFDDNIVIKNNTFSSIAMPNKVQKMALGAPKYFKSMAANNNSSAIYTDILLRGILIVIDDFLRIKMQR